MSNGNPALSVGQPIGYVAPIGAAKLALGLADPLSVSAIAAGPTTLTASYLGGQIFTGFGQSPNANDSARLLGLNAT